MGFIRKKSRNYKKKETVDFSVVTGGSDIKVRHPTFTVEEYVNTAIQTGWEITRLFEDMSIKAKVDSVADFEIPSRIVLKLRKR